MIYRTLERILSPERLAPYLAKHGGDIKKAIDHYKANIKISESFYPGIAILEVGLRNNIDLQLKRKYGTDNWFDDAIFIRDVSSFQIDKISDARRTIHREKKTVTSGKMVAELTFGFWTSLFDAKFERVLWKDLRLAFPKCPKKVRQRKNVSSKLNSIRKFRHRVFHHEPISWSITALDNYKKEIIEGIHWLNGNLTTFFKDTIRIEEVLRKQEKYLKQ